MNCVHCQQPIRKSDVSGLYVDANDFANCAAGPHAPAPPVAEDHPHIIEKQRLEDIIGANLPEPNIPEKAQLRLYVLNEIIRLASDIQCMDDSYCYMTACDLIEELLFTGQKKGE